MWFEVNFLEKTWTLSGARTKSGKPHKVPLSDRAMTILSALPRHGERVFPLSDMVMLELVRGMRPGLTVHGFRATFRTWVEECTRYPHVVAELALGHTQSDKLMQAYQRSELFEKRRRLMVEWERFCAARQAKGHVVSLGAR